MREILFMPIEPIEERYSAQWLDWFLQAFDWNERKVTTFGCVEPAPIVDGEFLDSSYTMRYKLDQAFEVCTYIEQNRDKKFTVFCLDTWNPCLLNIAYMRDTLGLDIEIKSMIHAGVYDPHDYLSKCNVANWGAFLERSLYEAHDEIFIATDFHKELFAKTHDVTDKFTKVNWPVFKGKDIKWEDKADVVLFPHRLATEKRPDLFDALEEFYNKTYPEDGLIFIKTKDVCNTKQSYYQWLKQSKFAVSFAEQETFGIAMQEAVNYNCIPIVPDKLSYKELYKNDFKFRTVEEAAYLIHKYYADPKFQPVANTEHIDWIDLI